MLPPSYLDRMPDAFVQLWQQVEDDILRDVARRIGKMDKVTATANWQRWRYQQTEAVRPVFGDIPFVKRQSDFPANPDIFTDVCFICSQS